MARAKDVRESSVISRWGVLAEGQAGKESQFFTLVQDRLKQHGWPHRVREVQVGAGGLFGNTKPYLETKQGKVIAYIGAESIGLDAYMGWSLSINEGGCLAVFGLTLAIFFNTSEKIFQNMTFNEVNTARAFASSMNYAVQEAVDAVLDEAGLDKSKVNREATGALGRLI